MRATDCFCYSAVRDVAFESGFDDTFVHVVWLRVQPNGTGHFVFGQRMSGPHPPPPVAKKRRSVYRALNCYFPSLRDHAFVAATWEEVGGALAFSFPFVGAVLPI